LYEQQEFFAVRCEWQNGIGLALDSHGGRSLFTTEEAAVEFRRELIKHISARCKVIRVKAIFEECME